ncbi:MAG: hypothetical protein M3179_04570 [Actinomycetota bacterium]|nr:hypothetical protein [Actinomycetota bacterium]
MSTLVSHVPASPTTTSTSHYEGNFVRISADGGVVAFDSPAADLVAGQVDFSDMPDVFVFEREVAPHGPPPADFDGDADTDTDVSVFRPSNGYWFVNGGQITQFGTNADIPSRCPRRSGSPSSERYLSMSPRMKYRLARMVMMSGT